MFGRDSYKRGRLLGTGDLDESRGWSSGEVPFPRPRERVRSGSWLLVSIIRGDPCRVLRMCFRDGFEATASVAMASFGSYRGLPGRRWDACEAVAALSEGLALEVQVEACARSAR